jgi:Tfp pilus assembly protein PilW
MKQNARTRQSDGFSLLEILVCLLIMIPIMGAAVKLFSVGANQHASEQNSIDSNQEARSGLEIMTLEVAQAGSHGDRATTTSGSVTGNASAAQSLSVGSSAGFNVGDYIDVDTGADRESVKVTAVATGSISAIYRKTHTSGKPLRLFALPYRTGVVKPSSLGSNASTDVTVLKFYGDVNGDGNLAYVEYAYDANNAQINRSMTPINQSSKNAALPLITNIKPNSAQFTLQTDGQGVVTSVTVRMTIQNTVKTVSAFEETALASKIVIPSAVAASALFAENQLNGGISQLPPTPAQVTTWAQ